MAYHVTRRVLICETLSFLSTLEYLYHGGTVGVQPILWIFHMLLIDFAGPLPSAKDSSKCLLVAVEHLTGWPIVRAVGSQI